MKAIVGVFSLTLALIISSSAWAGWITQHKSCKESLNYCMENNKHKRDAQCKITYDYAVTHNGQWNTPEAQAASGLTGQSSYCFIE